MNSVSESKLQDISCILADRISSIEDRYSVPYRRGYEHPEVLTQLFNEVADVVGSYYTFERRDLLKVIESIWFRESGNTFAWDLVFNLEQVARLYKDDECFKDDGIVCRGEAVTWPDDCAPLEELVSTIDRKAVIEYIKRYSVEDIVANNTNVQLWRMFELCCNASHISGTVKYGVALDMKNYVEKYCKSGL